MYSCCCICMQISSSKYKMKRKLIKLKKQPSYMLNNKQNHDVHNPPSHVICCRATYYRTWTRWINRQRTGHEPWRDIWFLSFFSSQSLNFILSKNAWGRLGWVPVTCPKLYTKLHSRNGCALNPTKSNYIAMVPGGCINPFQCIGIELVQSDAKVTM